MTQCKRCGVTHTGSEALCARCLIEVGMAEEPSAPAQATRSHVRLAAPTPAELAPLFPELEIEEMIGQGGMGAVYRATQKALGRKVALKVLLGDLGQDPNFSLRFQREARTLAALAHPSCVVIHDFGERGGFFFLLMELVDGANLRQLLKTRAVAPREALSIVGQICDGLQYAHDSGVVHRDIKPENILVTRDGRVKILDYGLAKLIDPAGEESHLTGTFQAMGSVHYMAPEQWKHPLEVDHRADIFSLGVVFYELLTGELPVGRFPLPSQKVEVDVRLDEVVLKALEIDPERRWQHASEVKTQMQGLGQSPVRRSAPEVARAPKKRRGFPVWAIVLSAIFLGLPVLFVALLLPVRFLGHQTNDLPGTIMGTLPPLSPSSEQRIEARLEIAPEGLFEEDSRPVPATEPDPLSVEEGYRMIGEGDVLESPPPLFTRDRRTRLDLTERQAQRLESTVRGVLLFQKKYEQDAIRSCRLTSPGNLVVELDAFPEKLASLREKLEARVRQLTGGTPEVERLIEELYPEGLLARGEVPLRIHIQHWKDGFRAREESIEEADGPVTQYWGQELMPRYQRLWRGDGVEGNLPSQRMAQEEHFPRTIDGSTLWLLNELVELGIPVEDTLAVSEALVEARDRYLALEEEASTLRWSEDGHLLVTIAPFLEEGAEPFHETTWKTVRALVSDPTRLPGLKGYLELDDLFLRGSEAVELDQWIEQDHFLSRAGKRKVTCKLTDDGEVPLHAPEQRFWRRGLELARPGK